jgi:CheY-like chemotaxis protein
MPPDRPLVLIVDNYADNREMYAEYLRTCGFRVIACSDSLASLDLARSCVPDIILLEVRMNRMNGVELLALLQREPSLANVPVVALTASVLSFDRDAAVAAGFTELLAKPCFPEDLARAITRIIAAARPAASTGQARHHFSAPHPHSRLRTVTHVERGPHAGSQSQATTTATQLPNGQQVPSSR